ncbi:MAG: hypothetical protein ED859_08725 [Desulfuromonadales bacterium]|nr:MAG: hypothetical protein ED859_08725 [Desulfuromonadales bacterium]
MAPRRQVEASAGYRFVSTNDYGGRAAEYTYLHSSFAGGAQFMHLGEDLKLSVDGTYLNTEDYSASLAFDYAGYYRLNLRTESLFHNLDHLTSPLIVDQSPSEHYGITTRQDSATFRYKLHDYPVHLNLSHWLIARNGDAQLRFADSPYANILSRTRQVDGTSSEDAVGLDAHLGPVNLVYSFLIRQFDDRNATPAYPFVSGPTQHAEDPESRYYAHTVKLYTSLSGGLTGAASYSYGRRENRSALTTVSGADATRDTLNNAAGDVTFTPCALFSTALKFRHQEINRESPASLVSPFFADPVIPVRPAIDSQQDIISATLSFRPSTILTVNGEYKGTFQHRDNTGNARDLWSLSENSDSHRGTLTVLIRPFKGLRLRSLYGYTTTSHPFYNTDPRERHEGQFLATYTSSAGKWGGQASYRVVRDKNDAMPVTTTFPISDTDIISSRTISNHGAFSFWLNPVERLTVSVTYGLLWKKTDEDVFFSSIAQAGSDYVSQAHVYSINAVYRPTDTLDLSLAFQQIRSNAEFSPNAVTSTGSSTAGIKELSAVRSIEHAVSARADYRLTKNFGCSLDYTFRDYDNRESSYGEGAVHLITAQLKTIW